MLRAAVLRLPFLAMLVLVSFVGAHLLTATAPGDAAYESRALGREAYAAERARRGLDRSAAERLRERLTRAARLDFGTSSRFGLPVLPLVADRAGNTLLAGSLALTCALALGLPAGVASARLRSRHVRALIGVVSLVIVSVPSLVAALLLVVALARTDMPALVVAVIALAVPAAALIERLQAAAFRDVAGSSFVVAARARGIPERRAAWRHAWPLSLPAVIGVTSLIASQLVSGALAVELVTGWPGLGRLTYDALVFRDADLAAACVAAAAALVGLAAIVSDVVLAALDPRVSAT